MRERRLSVTQIAYEVGYEHPANFSTAFRRHFGLLPRDVMARSANGFGSGTA